MMQKAVVSACASTLPGAAACWYLLHPSAAVTCTSSRVGPCFQTCVVLGLWAQTAEVFFYYYFLNGITCFDGTKLRL